MDGFELLQELRADPSTKSIPIIMLSARAGEESRVEGLRAGADDYLVKPFSARELLARVKAHIDLNLMRQEAQKQVSTILNSITDGFVALDREWRFTYINRKAEEILRNLQLAPQDLMGRNIWEEFPDLVDTIVHDACTVVVTEQRPATFEVHYPALQAWFGISAYPSSAGLSVYFQEITARKKALEEARENAEILETINSVGQLLTGELDLHKLVQAVTDAATELIGAGFGSFIYNIVDDRGAPNTLYTLSGALADASANLRMPRAGDIPGSTFLKEVVRVDDVRLDPRTSGNSSYYGIPEGNSISVTSYMAVPVVSRSGEALGGLFFCHSDPGVFTERDERVVSGLAGQAAIAIDNARLFDAIKKERTQAGFLAEASETLAESLDYETTLKNLARVAVKYLGDWCVIDVVDEKGGLRRVASAHNNPLKEELLMELQDKFPPDWNSP